MSTDEQPTPLDQAEKNPKARTAVVLIAVVILGVLVAVLAVAGASTPTLGIVAVVAVLVIGALLFLRKDPPN